MGSGVPKSAAWGLSANHTRVSGVIDLYAGKN